MKSRNIDLTYNKSIIFNSLVKRIHLAKAGVPINTSNLKRGRLAKRAIKVNVNIFKTCMELYCMLTKFLELVLRLVLSMNVFWGKLTYTGCTANICQIFTWK